MLRRWFEGLRQPGGRSWTKEDAQQFESDALEHLDALYRTALRMTRRPEDAEDLVQETYLKAFRFADRFEPGTNLRAWLFKIMTNTFLSRRRQVAAGGEAMSIDDVGEYFIYNKLADERGENLSASAEDAALAKFIDLDVKAAIDQLPEEFRLVVLLCDVEGFSYKEIAGIAGIPLGTVMSRLSRGRKLLQRHLWQYARPIEGSKKESEP